MKSVHLLAIFYRVCHHLPNAPYDNRLQLLGLERLELRRLHADLCFVFKIIKNFVSLLYKKCFTVCHCS